MLLADSVVYRDACFCFRPQAVARHRRADRATSYHIYTVHYHLAPVPSMLSLQL